MCAHHISLPPFLQHPHRSPKEQHDEAFQSTGLPLTAGTELRTTACVPRAVAAVSVRGHLDVTPSRDPAITFRKVHQFSTDVTRSEAMSSQAAQRLQLVKRNPPEGAHETG